MRCKGASLGGLLLLFAVAATAATAPQQTARVVVAGGGLTETLYALGVESRIVGVDTTSTWPKAARNKPQIGYMRNLSAEGILSLSPTLVLTTDEAGPVRTLRLVKAAGVPVRTLPAPRSADDVKHVIHTLARLFDREEQGQALIDRLTASLDEAARVVASYPQHPRVLFVLSADAQLLAGGRDTAADAMIRLAGGHNVIDYTGYKPLTPEAAVRLAPQVIVTVDFVVESKGGKKALLDQPPLSLTPAGRSGRLVVMKGERLLGFGPRLGQTVADLARRIHQGDGS